MCENENGFMWSTDVPHLSTGCFLNLTLSRQGKCKDSILMSPGPAIGGVGSNDVLCKACTVLLCVLEQPRVVTPAWGPLSVGLIENNWSSWHKAGHVNDNIQLYLIMKNSFRPYVILIMKKISK